MYHIDTNDKNKHCSWGEYGFKLIVDVELSVVETHKEVVVS